MFTDQTYLYPPRPTSAILPGMLSFYGKRKGWVTQAKLNGTNTVIELLDGKFDSRNRHAEPHKQWNGSRLVSDPLCAAFGKGRTVLVGELMHNKVPGMKDTVYLHDLLVFEDQTQVGKTYAQRYELLRSKLGSVSERQYWHEHTPNVLIAKNQTVDAATVFKEITSPYVEGLVLKDSAAVLTHCAKEGSNTTWSVKCRKSTKNYTF